jgi:hypothetical protein
MKIAIGAATVKGLPLGYRQWPLAFLGIIGKE